MDTNRNLFQALKLEKWAMFVILTLIVIVAANIVSTLSVMVTDKTKDIGILKAIGATKKVVMAIFSLQGLMIGVFGVTGDLFGNRSLYSFWINTAFLYCQTIYIMGGN